MELGYGMLWRVLSWFLVSFLVARLVSLFVSSSSCKSAYGHVKDSSFKRSAPAATPVVDHDGKKLKVNNDGRRVTKRVKFDDQLVKVVEFNPVEEVSVRDIEMDCGEVNVVDGDLGKKFGSEGINECLIDEKLVNEGFDIGKVGFDDYGESGEFGEELVGQIVEKKEFVGEEAEVGGELESSDKIVGCGRCEEKERIVEHIKEDIVPFGNEEVHDIGLGLGGDKVVDDDQGIEANSSNVHKGGGQSGSVEFVGHSIEGILECGDKEGYAPRVGLDEDQSENVSQSNAHEKEEIGMEMSMDEGVLSDDDEWEGVERSELEKKFASAVNFVGCQDTGGRLAKVDSDVMTQLYGLQKIAMEGQCHEPQPMPLKLSARAKWNAWQKLGNMSREEAMEQYINILSDNVSEWMEGHSSEEDKARSFTLM